MEQLKIIRFVFNMLGVNTYLLFDESTREAIIIDAACYSHDESERLHQYITQNGLHPTRLLNTHLHFDHIFGNRFIYDHYGLKPEAHPADEDWLLEAKQRTRMFGLEFPGETIALGHYLADGEKIETGGMALTAIHIPGHSAGSLVFYEEKQQVLFTGDVLFNGSVGRADLPGGDMNLLVKGIREHLTNLPHETLVLPGHGEPTTIGEELTHNPYL